MFGRPQARVACHQSKRIAPRFTQDFPVGEYISEAQFPQAMLPFPLTWLVMIDDEPSSSNNQSGLFGIEIEATTKVSVRNIWVKKLS